MSRERTILLLTGEYPERLSALYRAVQDARRDQESGRGAPATIGTDPVVELARDYEALKAEAEESATRVTLRALTRGEWRTLKANHPPRSEGTKDETDADKIAGVNTESVEDDLVHAAMTFPEFTSRAAFDEWANDLAEADWRLVMQTAWALVTESRFDPKSLPASQTRNSASS